MLLNIKNINSINWSEWLNLKFIVQEASIRKHRTNEEDVINFRY